MATRKEQRDAARAERRAREEAERTRAARGRRLRIGGGAVAAVVVIAVIAIVAATSGGNSSKAASGASAGLQTGPAPWAPEYSQLAARLNALNLPGEGTAYHVHALLRVYVNGQQIQVPADVGIDPQGQFIAPLHTHDTTGIIHMEANQQFPFTLGQFVTTWGVRFTPTQLGGYTAANGSVVATYVNGKQVANGPAYVLKPHDAIVLAYGKTGSFPTSFTPSFAAGL